MEHPMFYLGQALGVTIFFALLYGFWALIKKVKDRFWPPKKKRSRE